VELFGSASEELKGKIDYRHVYLNFTNIEVELDNKKVVKTCPAALGPGFAAGTTDGPGVFGFQQGDPEVSVPIVTLCTQHMNLCFLVAMN
jgi:neutral ceramidase